MRRRATGASTPAAADGRRPGMPLVLRRAGPADAGNLPEARYREPGVTLDRQRRGIGRALVETLIAAATS